MVREEAKKEMEGLTRTHDDLVKVMREKHEQDIAQVCSCRELSRQFTFVVLLFVLCVVVIVGDGDGDGDGGDIIISN